VQLQVHPSGPVRDPPASGPAHRRARRVAAGTAVRHRGAVAEWSDVARYLTTDALAHLATLGKDGGPRSVPVWVGIHDGLPDSPGGSTDDLTGGQGLAFFTEEGSVKDRNLARDPRLALSVTAPGNPLSMATVRGEVVTRLTGEAAMAVVDRISHAYTGGPYEIRSGFVAFLVRPTSWWANDYSEG